MSPSIIIAGRKIGVDHPPLVIAEIGINHEGDIEKAKQMIRDASEAGAECVKFQSHVVDDEMIPDAQKIIPSHTTESIWDIMKRCAFSEQQEQELKDYAEGLGLLYLCTPFSRAAADRLQRLKIKAYKIGSGECNNYPLLEHIASFGKPIILSTGMNDLRSISRAVSIFKKYDIAYALLNCTSMYPTPYDKVRLGGLTELRKKFPQAVIGQSDHSLGNYTCFAAVALGASIIEKHFTSNKTWPGPDIAISIDPAELKELIKGSVAIHQALGGGKTILKEEQPVIDFAYASVVTIRPVEPGELFTKDNLWVKRPGTGEILARDWQQIIGKKSRKQIPVNTQLKWSDIAR